MPYKPTGRPPGRPRHPEPLTPAEQRVLRHLRHGKTNAEIADELDISPDAVKYHVSNMLGKLQLESREQLAAWREPSPVARVWAAIGGLGWKLVGGVAAVVIAATGVGVLLAFELSHSGTAGTGADRSKTVRIESIGAATDSSSMVAISANGRFAAFVTLPPAQQMVQGSAFAGVYLLDVATGDETLVSKGIGGLPANGDSLFPSISADGRYVAFQSAANNLVPGDRNGDPTSVENALPATILGSIGNLSGVGRERWLRDVGGCDVFLFDSADGSLRLISVSSEGDQGDWGSRRPSISADGKKIAFESLATNLVPGDTNFGRGSTDPYPVGGSDIFIRDISKSSTVRASVAAIDDEALGSSAAPFIAASGDAVSFISDALNFPEGSHSVMKGYMRDSSAETRLLSVPLSGSEIPQHSVDAAPRLSADANLVLFAAVNYWDHTSAVYLYDRGVSKTVPLWSAVADDWPIQRYMPVMSPNGRYILFQAPGVQTTESYGPRTTSRLMFYETSLGTTSELIPATGSGSLDLISSLSIADDGTFVISKAAAFGETAHLYVGSVR